MLALAMARPWFDFENAALISADGCPVELTAQERALVDALRTGGLKRRDVLVVAVWPGECAPESAYDRALEQLASRVRDKLAAAGYNPQALRARRFLGYQLDEERL